MARVRHERKVCGATHPASATVTCKIKHVADQPAEERLHFAFAGGAFRVWSDIDPRWGPGGKPTYIGRVLEQNKVSKQ